MTWRDVAKVLLGSWTSQVASWDPEGVAAYIHELQSRGVSPDEAAAALRASTSEFPPSAGTVVATIERLRQGPVPDYMTATRVIGSKITLLDYYRPAMGFDRFVEACASVHEAIGRFALEMGPQGVREMPDPRMAQDTSGSTAITRAERAYRKVAKEWDENPRPGLALEEAKRIAIGPGSSGGMVAVVQGLAPAGELEAGPDATSDGDGTIPQA